MIVRTLSAAVAVLFAAGTASAQHFAPCAPVVYHTPAVTWGTPVVYHAPAHDIGTPVFQSGQWYGQPSYVAPQYNRPVLNNLWNGGRTTEYADGLGFPFNNRPGLNIAYRLLTR